MYIKSISVTYEEAAATVPVTGVSLNKSTLTLTEGDSETLTATVAPANATDKTVTWSTSDANIATVSNGKVTAVAEGTAKVTVTTTDGGKTATCNVTVNPKPKYTVTWDVNGDQSVTTQVTEGSKPIFPATPSSCDATSNTFYGWATATWDGKIDNIIGKTIYTSANDMPAVNGAVTYYAVFATKGAGGGAAFDGTSGGDFKIYALVEGEKKYLKGTGSKISPVDEAQATEYTFTKINDGVFSIKTGTTYLTYASSTDLGTSTTSYSWNISKGTKGSWRIASAANSSRGIVYRASSYNQFGGYSTSNITENGTEYYDVEIGGGASVSYSGYITTCAAGDPCDALQAPNVTATATANSITLSWAAVDGATSYNIYNYTTGDLDETTSLTYTFTGLSYETEYEWGVESAKDECFKETRGTTTTKKACTDAVTIGKGTETNGTFTLSTTGRQSTCEGPVTVTLSDIEPATGYQFSEITQSGVDAAKVTIDNNNKTVTYAKNTTGTSTINVTFIEIPKHTVTLNPNYPNGTTGTFKDKDGNTVNGNLVLTYDYNTASKTIEDLYTSLTLDGYEFGGWYNAKGSNPGEVSGSICTTTGSITSDKTYYAKWSKLYTITLSENGTTNELAPQTSTSYTLPTELSAGTCQDDTKELVGWSTVAIPNPGDKPTSNFYELGATVPLTEDQTTFYAVFATADNGGVDNTDYSNVHTSNVTLDKTGGTNATDSKVKIGGIDYTAVKAGTGSAQGAVKITVPAGTTKLSFHMAGWNGEGNKTISLSGATADPSSFETVADAGVSGNSTTYTLSGTIANYFYSTTLSNIDEETTLTFSNGGADQRFVIWGVNASTGGAAFYSDYSTTCVKLPDPVLSFETEPANPIVFTDAVCGGNSSKQSVTVVGENLRDVVEVSVTGPYKIARTSSTALKDFTTSLTLDKTAAGAIHSNYQTVYIISTPPAQSTEATTGTLTFTTTKGNTLIVNLSTPTVTCTQYTLTLVDRGVSTLQPETYFAGQTIDEAPADPEGVCTDPIHYVFDGWAAATVAEGSTTYTKVTFPYTVTGNTKFYAVYRYLEGGGNGDYNLVTSALDDWSGDYLIAYSNTIFADGQVGGKDELGAIGAEGIKVDLSQYISNNTIPATEGDKYNVTLEAVTGGYVLKTKDGNYNYYTTNESNGISVSTKNTAANYPITVKFVSKEEINLCLGGSAIGSVFRYNAQGFFRFYKNGGQNPVYLYKKADGTTYYTTSPVCGPHLAITEGKEIYVTGGNAGGTRDLVIAQQKVSYKATRLQTSNGLADGTAPDVKVATNGITVDGVVTSDVKVTIDQTKEQQADGTYTITGTITVQYQPSANNKQEDIQVQLAVDYNAEARDNFTVHARSLPAEFVIVAKSGDKWYALNGDMSTNAANPANGQVTLDSDANPTKATYAPCNTIYTFDGVPNTGDRTYVRFQGTDGAWLWAASGTNVGIQNNVLKTTPEGNNNAYNWKLYTEDNITYRFGNANSSRQLTLNGEKFGMYASGVQDIRILPYVEKCLYNYAPTNLKVSVLKGTYVTLTWDAVAGATKYQYSTDATNWTDCGIEPTATIDGLTGDTEYTYYIRAYHKDAGVSQECIDYAEITFTTANCDDVPTDISFAAGIYSITLYWQCAAETSTVILYSDEAGTQQAIKPITDAKSPLTIDDLDKVTTYYAKILAGGTCASPLTTVSTAPPAVDVVEWKTDGMDVYVNTDDEIIVSLEGEVYEGSGSGNVATELFFSKYFEATGNVKLLALFNGTGQDIDLSTYSIKFSAKGADYTGATTTEEVKYDNTIELSEDIPDDRLILPAGKELIMISYPTSGAAGAVSITNPDGTTIKIDSKDAAILECAANNSQESGWDDYVRVTSLLLNFSGNDAVALFKGDQLVDIIGAGNTTNVNMSKVVAASTNPSFMDAAGWYNANGYQIQPDGTIGTTNDYPLSTNRCLLIRRNTVINGDNAVEKNTTDFVTLGGQESEWMGYQIPDGNGACEGFEYVGKYDYANYYTTYDKVGEDQTFESGSRNPDGTVPVSIPEIGKYSCKNLKITVKDEEQVLVVQEFKVPIIVAKNQNTDGEVFTALKTTLGTVVVDKDGIPTGEIEPLTEEEWIEECKECDIVVRDNATLTHVTTGLEQFRNLTIYPTGKLSNIESKLAVNRLMIQAENDQVGYAIIEKGKGSITANAIAHTKRIDAQYWYAFSLPYDCNINEITQANGESMGEYGVHWGIQYYDGKRRQYEGTSANLGQSSKFWLPMGPNDKLNAYQGYLIALFDASVQKPTDMRTIYFPPAEENTYTESGSDSKQTNVYSWNVNLTCEKRHHGWNFTGTPYISMFNPVAAGITNANLSNVLMTGTWDPVENEYKEDEHVYVSIPTPNGGKYYNQHLASTKELLPFMAYFVQTSDPTTGDETKQLTYAKGGRKLPAAAPARAAATAQRVLVELLVTAPDGQTDNTGVWVDENYVPEYELAADLTKMYVAGEKPQLYTLAANNEKMAYNALPDGAATNIPLGLHAPIAGDYNLSLNERMSRIAGAESVELIYNNAVVANLLFQDYTITANKGNVNGYSLCIRRRANVTTAVDNVTGSVITMIVNDGYISVLGVPTDATVYVYDMVGHLMEMQSANGNTVVNMPSVPQGVYNIVITSAKGSTTIKSFVK